MALYVACGIIVLVLGTTVIVYAHVSWVYLVVLVVVTAWTLTAVKYLGSKRSEQTLKKVFKAVSSSHAISTFCLAVFVWLK